MGFPEEIKIIRQRYFLTQSNFAKEVKVAFSTVNKGEGSKAKPNLTTMKNFKEFSLRSDIMYDDIEETWLDYTVEVKEK